MNACAVPETTYNHHVKRDWNFLGVGQGKGRRGVGGEGVICKIK